MTCRVLLPITLLATLTATAYPQGPTPVPPPQPPLPPAPLGNASNRQADLQIAALQTQLDTARAQLAGLQVTLAEGNPRIVSARASIRQMESDLAREQSAIASRRSQPRVMQLRMPRAEPGSDLNIVPSGTWWRYPETIKDLTLTPDQQRKMDDIFRQNRIQLIDLKASLEKEQLNLEPILNGNPPDTGKAYAEIAHIADLRADLEKANAKMLLGLRALLTADQWTRLQAHRPGASISTDDGQTWQAVSSLKSSSNTTTCNAMFNNSATMVNNSARDCTITTVSTRKENGHTVVTTCISTAAQSTPKCTTSPGGSTQSMDLILPWDAITPPAASFTLEIPSGFPIVDPLP